MTNEEIFNSVTYPFTQFEKELILTLMDLARAHGEKVGLLEGKKTFEDIIHSAFHPEA